MLVSQLQLAIDRNAKQPAYLQLANQLIQLIRTGELRAGQKLIGTRSLAELLDIHRKTVVQAYDELLVQGWLESKTGSGTYVAETLPEVEPQKLSKQTLEKVNPAKKAGFAFTQPPHLRRDVLTSGYALHLDDG
ncbi:MAG TPA: GntR family transcriptional regulator, partial [Runella sp.]|nr:GntR family transcriptional regulator [Runella sp.]